MRSIILGSLLSVTAVFAAFGQGAGAASARLLVEFAPDANAAEIGAIHRSLGVRVVGTMTADLSTGSRLDIVEVAYPGTLDRIADAYRSKPSVLTVQADFAYSIPPGAPEEESAAPAPRAGEGDGRSPVVGLPGIGTPRDEDG